jgi:hypothetical protein
MDEQIVLIETAQLAKEKGFDIKIFKDSINYHINPPTQSILQKWLRNNHNIHIEISRGGHPTTYHVFIKDYIYSDKNEKKEFNTYELALEEGLQEALKLI